MEALGINWQLLVAFLINFIILAVLLSLVLYKPVTKMLNERQERIKQSMEQAEAIKQQTAQTEQEIRKQLEVAQKESQAILAQAAQIGEKLKGEARDAARKEAETIIAKAQVEIERQREKDFQELRAQFADIAILAAEKVIKETIDKEKNRKLIDEVLKNKLDI
jgi:F-type H+-transporting ATPase subunit b